VPKSQTGLAEWHLFRRRDGLFAWHLIALNGSDIIATDGGQGYDNASEAAAVMRSIRDGVYKSAPMEPH
jgi:uncharacterized protein YegP (UPF0339 family)